jgi:hypothetical protein
MPILNYTTSIAVDKTVAEIQRNLAKAKAQAVLTEFDGAGNVIAISFRIMTQFGVMSFRLPADAAPVLKVINGQVQRGEIPRRYMHDMDQARRVAWRIVKDWVEAQLAIVETEMVRIEQVFLPYAQDADGQTIYEKLNSQRYSGLALPPPK